MFRRPAGAGEPAADPHLGRADVPDLQPLAGAPARVVQRRGTLEHDPLQALGAGNLQQRRGIARERGRHLHGAGHLEAEILQQGAAQHVRAAGEVLAAGAAARRR